MPHHKSAKKRLRQSAEHRLRNRGQRTTLRRVVRAARADDGQLTAAQSAADIAAQSGIIHPNKAARLKSRLMKQRKVQGEPKA